MIWVLVSLDLLYRAVYRSCVHVATNVVRRGLDVLVGGVLVELGRATSPICAMWFLAFPGIFRSGGENF